MRIVLPGGTGHVGASLREHFASRGDDVVVISRSGGNARWDGKTPGEWVEHLNGADAVINLAGRSVNCRYNDENLREMMDSRVDSTRAIGQAISRAKRPPKVWLQMSTATIYAHRFDAANDEANGIIGGSESGVPKHWKKSVDIALAWESAQNEAETPSTRKVAMRSAMVMSPEKGSIFATLASLARRGLGGPIAGGKQFMSWIHERDFCRAVDFLIREDLSGAVNVASPNPLTQTEFMRTLRQTLGVRVGLPATRWMVEIGTRVLGTESELVLKSRRVVPGRLRAAGFDFEFPLWQEACRELAGRLVR
jgi:uncharacterized protein (TIGR01777 family)